MAIQNLLGLNEIHKVRRGVRRVELPFPEQPFPSLPLTVFGKNSFNLLGIFDENPNHRPLLLIRVEPEIPIFNTR